jgi:hypothetical protein
MFTRSVLVTPLCVMSRLPDAKSSEEMVSFNRKKRFCSDVWLLVSLFSQCAIIVIRSTI